MQVSTKDKKLILMISGLALFLIVYMYVFTPMQNKTAQMQSEIERLERECRELEIQNTNMQVYEEQIVEYRAAIAEMVKSFPVDVKEEDVLVYLLNLQEANEIELFSIAFNEPVNVVNFDGVMEVEGADKAVHMLGEQHSTTATAELTYAKLKAVLNYIYNTKTQTTLESVTVVYDSKNDVLNGSFDFSRYTLNYDEAEYKPEKLPEVEIGQEDLFGDN